MPFRQRACKFFLTYPHCDSAKAGCLERASVLCPNYEWIIVAQELHEDGSPHLHVAIKLKEIISISNPKHFDVIAGKHGNYQIMRNCLKSIQYCSKEDQEPLCLGIDIKAALQVAHACDFSNYDYHEHLVVARMLKWDGYVFR